MALTTDQITTRACRELDSQRNAAIKIKNKTFICPSCGCDLDIKSTPKDIERHAKNCADLRRDVILDNEGLK
jgi:hypothetical protein